MVDKYKMDGHKLMYHGERIKDWQTGKRIAPLYIDMGITLTCNIACEYCYYAVPENKQADMIPTDALIRFLNDAAEIGTKAIGFLGDGEPMIHPGVYDAVAAGAKAGLDMSLSTNGVIMREERLPEFLESLVWLRFNVSAASPEKFAKVMGTTQDNFRSAVKNIRKCVEIKKKYDLKTTLGLQMVLVPECSDEIVAFAKMGKELGVDYVVIKQCSENEHYKLNSIDLDYSKHEAALKEAESLSDENYNVIIKWNKMMNNGVRNYDQCFGCEFLPQISGNGDVYNCGNFFGNKEFYIGSIAKESFKDIVFGKRYGEVMDMVKTSVDVHSACGVNCRQNEINEFLWKLDSPVAHVNFV